MLGILLGLSGSGNKSVDLSTYTLFGGAYGPATATSPYVSVIQTGLVAPINYLWTRVSGDTSIYSPSLNVPTLRFNGFVNGSQISAVWKCTVTDAVGFSMDTPNLTIVFEDYFV